jgi:hypothetical protein
LNKQQQAVLISTRAALENSQKETQLLKQRNLELESIYKDQLQKSDAQPLHNHTPLKKNTSIEQDIERELENVKSAKKQLNDPKNPVNPSPVETMLLDVLAKEYAETNNKHN